MGGVIQALQGLGYREYLLDNMLSGLGAQMQVINRRCPKQGETAQDQGHQPLQPAPNQSGTFLLGAGIRGHGRI